MDGLPVQVFPGRQHNSLIIHGGDGFHYNFRERRGDRVRLQCRHYRRRVQGCPGTARVSLNSGLLHHLQPHNHVADPLLFHDFQLRQAMIREAQTNVFGTKLRSILDEFKIRAGNPFLACRFTTVRMHSALYNARSSNYPRIPSTLIYLGVLLGLPNMRALCKTVDGVDYIFQGVVGCVQNKSIALIFVSGRMLMFLGTLENIHADGTFKKRPKKPNMSQIFNIVTNYGGVVIAVARVLMMSRCEEAYFQVIYHLKTLAPSWEPLRIHSDFERAMMNAFRRIFPRSRIVGCLWHFAVAFSRHCRKLGLQQVAQESDVVHAFIRCIAGMPLLPEDMMWTGILQIWQEVVDAGMYDLFLPVFQYMETEWKPRKRELSCFGVPERTNNCSESDNKSLGNLIPQQRPNIWHLTGSFVKLEYLAFCDKIAVDNLQPVTRARRWTAVLNDENVKRAANLLLTGQKTPAQFLHQASFAVIAAVNYGLLIQPDDESDSE